MTLREKLLLPLELKRLERIANKLTKQVGITAKIGNDFQALPNKNTIFFALLENELDANLFYSDILQNFPKIVDYDIEPFVFSFLHEIGHCVTKTAETTEDLELRDNLKDMQDRTTANKLYFQLPAEKSATTWGIAYAMIYYDDILKWQRQMLNAYKKFFKKFQISD